MSADQAACQLALGTLGDQIHGLREEEIRILGRDLINCGTAGDLANDRAAISAGTFAAFEADFHAQQARGDINPIGAG